MEKEKHLTTKKTTIKVLNDTNKELVVRQNIRGMLPTTVKVQPRKAVAVFMRTDEIFLKVWNGNVIMLKDAEKNLKKV